MLPRQLTQQPSCRSRWHGPRRSSSSSRRRRSRLLLGLPPRGRRWAPLPRAQDQQERDERRLHCDGHACERDPEPLAEVEPAPPRRRPRRRRSQRTRTARAPASLMPRRLGFVVVPGRRRDVTRRPPRRGTVVRRRRGSRGRGRGARSGRGAGQGRKQLGGEEQRGEEGGGGQQGPDDARRHGDWGGIRAGVELQLQATGLDGGMRRTCAVMSGARRGSGFQLVVPIAVWGPGLGPGPGCAALSVLVLVLPRCAGPLRVSW